MPRVFYGNFDFEHDLCRTGSGDSAGRLLHRQQSLSFAWLLAARDGDAIIAAEDFERGFLEGDGDVVFPAVKWLASGAWRSAGIRNAVGENAADWTLTPWGWTRECRSRALSIGLNADAPDEAAVRTANSRRFSFSLESEFKIGLPGACAITSMIELDAELSRYEVVEPWVVKAEFSMSARERILGRGPKLAQNARRWAEFRLERDSVLFLEPWVRRIDEWGAQIEIPRIGPPRILGVTPLLTDSQGRYLGSGVGKTLENGEFRGAMEFAERAAKRLQEAGYFGPAGIDMMRYRSEQDGTLRVRPLQDINARWTMGRLAWEARRFLRPGETGEWRHVRWNRDGNPDSWFLEYCRQFPSGTRIVRTSPYDIEGKPTDFGSLLLCVSEGAVDLSNVECSLDSVSATNDLGVEVSEGRKP